MGGNTSFLPADNANGLDLALNKISVITLGVVLLYSQLLDKRLVGLSNTLVKKTFAFVKVCTKVQSSEMTKNLSIFVNQTMEKLDISFYHDPQILKCKNEISFCLD